MAIARKTDNLLIISTSHSFRWNDARQDCPFGAKRYQDPLSRTYLDTLNKPSHNVSQGGSSTPYLLFRSLQAVKEVDSMVIASQGRGLVEAVNIGLIRSESAAGDLVSQVWDDRPNGPEEAC